MGEETQILPLRNCPSATAETFTVALSDTIHRREELPATSHTTREIWVFVIAIETFHDCWLVK
jgi:hypothetical protein